MQVIESRLQSKYSLTPDEGGEDRLVITDNFVAVIDGATAKTGARYLWDGDKPLTSGAMAAEILAKAIKEMDPALDAKAACDFLNSRILEAYNLYDIYAKVKTTPVERFTAIVALFNKQQRYVMLAGECQAVIDYKHYQSPKKVDDLNSEARAAKIEQLINEGELTEEALLAMDISQDPGRQHIMEPGANFPGLKEQSRHQNDPYSPYGYFAIDGFANPLTAGFTVIPVPEHVSEIILATDGYLRPHNMDPADSLYNLDAAEKSLDVILKNDPCCYKIYKGTKGKGVYHSFDDRTYVRFAI